MADGRVLLSLLVLAVSAHAFYLPGLAPTNFCKANVKEADKNANCKVSRGTFRPLDRPCGSEAVIDGLPPFVC